MPRSVAKKLSKGAQQRVVPSELRRHETHCTMAAAVADPRTGQAHARDGRREYHSGLVQRRRFFPLTEAAIAQALKLIDEGADILDLGAESTRPGSRAGAVPARQSAPMKNRRGLLPGARTEFCALGPTQWFLSTPTKRKQRAQLSRRARRS